MYFFPLLSFETQALISGKPLTGMPELVRLDFKNGYMCTGFFIDSTTIITAAHCLANSAQVVKIISVNEEVIPVQIEKNISHPDFDNGFWPTHDLGIIKTTKFDKFSSSFHLGESISISGAAKLYGSGVISFQPKKRDRSIGENNFLRFGSVLLFIGATSIAPNDSGAPVVDLKTGKVIAVATQSTAAESTLYLPTISVATSLLEKSNKEFVINNKEKN